MAAGGERMAAAVLLRGPGPRLAARLAYAAGLTGLVASLLLIGFYAFQLGREFSGISLGHANDLVGAAAAVLMIPVALALTGPPPVPRSTATVQWVGIAAMAVITVIGPLLVLGVMDFAVQGPIGAAAWVALIVWIWLTGRRLARASGHWRGVDRLGRVIGLAAAAAWLILPSSLLFPWLSVPNLIVLGLGVAVALVAYLGIPIWFLLVGRRLARGAPISAPAAPG